MYKINLTKPINVYFIGIGGISMSGLAKILKHNGFKVSGTDRGPSEQTDDLLSCGITVNFGHNADNITKDLDLVVYTAAISDDNPELLKAKEIGIPMLNRADLLGEIMENYKESITISGTHGKTTTTSMISLIMLKYTDPTLSIGGVLPAINSNCHVGNSDVFVTEACEYTNSFLSFYPKYNLILNIELDHTDFFKDLDDIRNSFKKFASNTKEGGYLILNSSIDNIEEIATVPNVSLFTFGLSKKSDLYANNIHSKNGKSTFEVICKGELLGNIELNVPGEKNIENALGAISLCYTIGVPFDTIKSALSEFGGTHRRFEQMGFYNGARIVNDYAHHPTEIASCIACAREYEPKRLFVVFQPHTYTRTKSLFDDFVKALSRADTVILSEIYAAREQNIYNISSNDIAKALKNQGTDAMFMETNEEILKFLKKNLMNGDLLIIMGAGDIYLLANEF